MVEYHVGEVRLFCMLIQLRLNNILQFCTAHVVFNYLIKIEQCCVYRIAFGNNNRLVSPRYTKQNLRNWCVGIIHFL